MSAPGRYAQHYRVLRPDGTTRRIHSQWEVKSASDGRPERVVGVMMDDTQIYDLARSLGDASASLKDQEEPGLDPALRSRLHKALSDRAESAEPAEQVLASATLLRLGDTGQRERLRHGLTTTNSETLQLAIEQTAADPELQRRSLPPLLEHPDFAVRLQAATSLAAIGEHSGVRVLREALARGEAHAIRAYGLLTQLGEAVQLPEHWAAPLASAELTTRLAAVEAVLHLPLELALDLLTRASRDPDRVVRRRVVELLGELPLGNRLAFATGLLRRMQDDQDAVVRALATAILARLLPRGTGSRAAADALGTVLARAGPDEAMGALMQSVLPWLLRTADASLGAVLTAPLRPLAWSSAALPPLNSGNGIETPKIAAVSFDADSLRAPALRVMSGTRCDRASRTCAEATERSAAAAANARVPSALTGMDGP